MLPFSDNLSKFKRIQGNLGHLRQFDTILGNSRQLGQFKTMGSRRIAGVTFFPDNLRQFKTIRANLRQFKTMGSM